VGRNRVSKPIDDIHMSRSLSLLDKILRPFFQKADDTSSNCDTEMQGGVILQFIVNHHPSITYGMEK
jgi:hypothetical protein